ncbi:MAG: hypothetical protein OES35_05915, partial [Chromatiales bacterium]|nr:hypothetical protein [Chromatiales bacterium]
MKLAAPASPSVGGLGQQNKFADGFSAFETIQSYAGVGQRESLAYQGLEHAGSMHREQPLDIAAVLVRF